MEKIVKNKDEIISMIPRHGEIASDDIIQKMIDKCNFTDSYAQYKWAHHVIEHNIRDEWIKKVGFVKWTASPMIEMFQLLKTDKWLEVMSGLGYFGTTMNSVFGTNIIITDNHSWYKETPAKKIEAVDAVEEYHNDVKGVIMSWPPYNTSDGANVLEACIKHNLPLIYIGESEGGCTADDRFFELIDEYGCTIENIIPSLRQFNGMHDEVLIIRHKANS